MVIGAVPYGDVTTLPLGLLAELPAKCAVWLRDADGFDVALVTSRALAADAPAGRCVLTPLEFEALGAALAVEAITGDEARDALRRKARDPRTRLTLAALVGPVRSADGRAIRCPGSGRVLLRVPEAQRAADARVRGEDGRLWTVGELASSIGMELHRVTFDGGSA